MDTMPAAVPDDMSWLFDEPFDETPDPDTSTWERFLELDWVDWTANFGCQGGDMDEVTGIVERVYKEGDSIKIKLRNAEISPELPEEKERLGVIERHEELILELETICPPIIRAGTVVLPGLRALPGWDLGSGYTIGFLFQRQPPSLARLCFIGQGIDFYSKKWDDLMKWKRRNFKKIF